MGRGHAFHVHLLAQVERQDLGHSCYAGSKPLSLSHMTPIQTTAGMVSLRLLKNKHRSKEPHLAWLELNLGQGEILCLPHGE